jgi:hypothetical protein
MILVILTTEAQAARAIPDDNIALPVSITLKTGSVGTGFFLRGKKFIYLVTAKHVLINKLTGTLLSDGADLVSYQKDPKDTSPTTMSLDLKALQIAGKIKYKNRDVVVVQIGKYEHINKDINPISFFSEVTSKTSFLNIVTAELPGLKKFSEVLVANDVVVFGYPISIGLIEHPQLDYARPLLRKGIVAGLNYSQNSIIIDCPSYPGNSGGPVIQVEELGTGTRKFSVIGVISEFVPFVESWINTKFGYSNSTVTNSGYSVAEPIDFALELLGDDA